MKNTAFPILTENEMRLPYYVFGIGIDHLQEHVLRSAGYPCYQWIQCRSGSGRLIIGGSEYHVGPEQGMLLFPDEMHEYYAEGDEWVVDWIGVTGNGIERFITDVAGLIHSGVYYISDAEALHQSMVKILETEISQSPVRPLECSALTYAFLIDLAKYTSAANANSMSSRYSRLNPVLEFIDEHYTESITLKQLSDLLSVTPQHLCTLFRKIMNTRIFEYINLIRIKKSKEFLLAQPTLAIRDIAHINGFEDVSYFCYIFKRVEKITPGEFRKLYLK